MTNQKLKTTSLRKNKGLLLFCCILLSILALLIGLYRHYFYFEKKYEFGAFELTEYWVRTLVTHSNTGLDDTKLCSKTLKRCWNGLRVLSQDSMFTPARKMLEEGSNNNVRAVYFLNTKKGIILDCKNCSRYGEIDKTGAFYFRDFWLERSMFRGNKEFYAGYVSELGTNRRKLILIIVNDDHMSVKELYENGVDATLSQEKVKFDLVSLYQEGFLWFNCSDVCSLINYNIESDSYSTERTYCTSHKNLKVYWGDKMSINVRQRRFNNPNVCKSDAGKISPPFMTKKEYEIQEKNFKKS